LLAQLPDIQEKALKEIKEFYSDNQPLCDPLDGQKCAYIAALSSANAYDTTPSSTSLSRAHP
jgi:hypothetical protein